MKYRIHQAALLLAALLQILPLVRNICSTPVAGSAFAMILRWGIGTGVALGAVDAVSGATSYFTTTNAFYGNSGSYFSNNIALTIGHTANNNDYFILLSGTNVSVPLGNNVSTTSALPTGLTFQPAWTNGSHFFTGVIYGTPLTQSTNKITITLVSPGNGSVAQTLSLNIAEPLAPTIPNISSQPKDLAIGIGRTATFGMTAQGSTNLAYFWLKEGSPLADGGNISGAQSNSLSITDISTNDVGTYSVIVSNFLGTAISSNASLSVILPPSILTSPTSLITSTGLMAQFTVTADGTQPLAYRWLKNNLTITNALKYTGFRSNVLTALNLLTNDGGNYSVVVTNPAGAVTSAVATLGVLLPPKFSQQATNRFTKVGTNSIFVSTVSGTGPFSYQWFKNNTPLADGGNIFGANSNILRVAVLNTNDSGAYSLFVTNLIASATSSNAVLTVLVKPVIIDQPTNQAIVVSNAAAFSVFADGTAPLRYQWRKGTTVIKGATNQIFNLSSVNTNDAGTYAVVITNRAGAVTSSVAILTVLLPPKFLLQATNRFTKVGTNSIFVSTLTGTAPLNYQWFKNGSPLADGSNIFGANSNVLRVAVLDTNDGGNYSVFVSNLVSTVTSSNALLTVLVRPSIIEQPTNQTVVVSNAVTFAVVADGTAPLRYQWKKGSTVIKGATNSSYTIPLVKLTDAATNYSVVVTNRAGLLICSNVTLTVLATALVAPNAIATTVFQTAIELNIHRNADGSMTLNLLGEANGNYLLQVTDRLEANAVWQTLGNASASTNGIWQMTDTDANNHSLRFYRVLKL